MAHFSNIVPWGKLGKHGGSDGCDGKGYLLYLVLDLNGVNLEDPPPLVNPPLLLPLEDEVGLTVVVFLAFF